MIDRRKEELDRNKIIERFIIKNPGNSEKNINNITNDLLEFLKNNNIEWDGYISDQIKNVFKVLRSQGRSVFQEFFYLPGIAFIKQFKKDVKDNPDLFKIQINSNNIKIEKLDCINDSLLKYLDGERIIYRNQTKFFAADDIPQHYIPEAEKKEVGWRTPIIFYFDQDDKGLLIRTYHQNALRMNVLLSHYIEFEKVDGDNLTLQPRAIINWLPGISKDYLDEANEIFNFEPIDIDKYNNFIQLIIK